MKLMGLMSSCLSFLFMGVTSRSISAATTTFTSSSTTTTQTAHAMVKTRMGFMANSMPSSRTMARASSATAIPAFSSGYRSSGLRRSRMSMASSSTTFIPTSITQGQETRRRDWGPIHKTAALVRPVHTLSTTLFGSPCPVPRGRSLLSSSSSSDASQSGEMANDTTTIMTTTAPTPTLPAVNAVSPPSPSSAMENSPRRVKVKHALQMPPSTTSEGSSNDPPDQSIMIQGWVRTVRKQKTVAFVEVNDGSSLTGIQGVLSLDKMDDTETLAALEQLSTGAAVQMVGPLVASQGGQQPVEVAVQQLSMIGECPADTYPLAKKRHSLEYLRSLAHLRARTNALGAVARVRSTLAGAIHAFFQEQGFVYVQTPLITASDCEGAGELFRVTTLNLDQVSKLPRLQDDQGRVVSDAVDYREDFFGKPAFLTVSGQLNAETYACALGDVYTFGPTFRAENSQTTRHLAEFHMLEPEMAFCDLNGAMDNAEQMLKYVVKRALDHCPEDLALFAKFYDAQLLDRLTKLVEQPVARISYRQAIEYLQQEIANDRSAWQFPDVEFGTDLATEHERWLAETKFQSAVFVYNYPAAIKAFYMRDNDDDGGETVNAMDLLVPGVGELIGGSQREERLEVLQAKLVRAGLDPAAYSWYLDLRRYGSVPHAGYGLGFERLVTYVCGLENIREAIAFPRYPGNAEF